MKAMKLRKEIKSFLDVAEATEEETPVFTKKKRPVAALVSLKKVDRESLALSTNPQFLRIIETARKEIRAGKTVSLEALEKKYGVVAPNKKMERTRKTRRSS
jgi:hypothetical protein